MNTQSQSDTNFDPEAVKWRIRGHALLAGLALLGSAVFVARGTFGGSSTDEAGTVLAGIAGFAAAAHLLLTVSKTGAIQSRPNATLLCALALLLVLAAPFAFLLPMLARPAEGWTLNPGGLGQARATGNSRIIAPGDSVTVKWEEAGIKSVKGLWRGTPKVEFLDAARLGCPTSLAGTGSDEQWGEAIWGKRTHGPPCAPQFRARFTIPDDPALAGKPLRVKIVMPVTYPDKIDDPKYHRFEDRSRTATCDATILLVSSEVKQAYWSSWWTGVTLGMVATTAGGLLLLWLALGLRARAVTGERAPLPRSLEHAIG